MSRPTTARLSMAVVTVAAVLLTGCSVLSPRSGGTSPTPIYGARSGDDGRSLVIGYEDGGCGGAPRPSSQQTSTDVTITVLLPAPPTNAACPADSQPKILVIALTAPLGQRRVVDGSTHKAVAVFDGSRLLHPTVFPDRVSVRHDWAPGFGSTSKDNWTQTYGRANPQAGCSTSPTVGVTEGTDVGSSANDLFTQVAGSHKVAGTTAQFLQDPSAPGTYYLEWSPPTRPGWRILIETQQACRGGPALTSTDLLRFANSFR